MVIMYKGDSFYASFSTNVSLDVSANSQLSIPFNSIYRGEL